ARSGRAPAVPTTSCASCVLLGPLRCGRDGIGAGRLRRDRRTRQHAPVRKSCVLILVLLGCVTRTFPCGLPRSDLDGADAFLVRRTLGRLRVTSVIVPQEDGTVLDFSYDEREPLARDVIAEVAVRRPYRGESMPCETLRA